jgi:hypothetical protein
MSDITIRGNFENVEQKFAAVEVATDLAARDVESGVANAKRYVHNGLTFRAYKTNKAVGVEFKGSAEESDAPLTVTADSVTSEATE